MRISTFAIFFAAHCLAAPPEPLPPAQLKSANITIMGIAPDFSKLFVAETSDSGLSPVGTPWLALGVGTQSLKDGLAANWRVGDFATVTYQPGTPPVLTGIGPRSVFQGAQVMIKSIADDHSEMIAITTAQNGSETTAAKLLTLSVTGQALKDSLKNWKPKDLASIGYTQTKNGAANSYALTDITPRTAAEVQGGSRPWALWASLAFGLILWTWQRRSLVGEDRRYSSSKFQMALWFSIVIAAYLATLLIRGFEFGSINIPTNLLLMSGLSLITFGGAKAITEGKVADALSRGAVAKAPNPNPPSLVNDLTHDDKNRPDLGDTQMIVITLLAAIVYIAQLYGFLNALELRSVITLPDVDNTLLASFGLGHGAYLVKKAVSGPDQ